MISCNGLVLDTPNVIDKVKWFSYIVGIMYGEYHDSSHPVVIFQDRNSIPMTERRAIKRKELNGKRVFFSNSWADRCSIHIVQNL